MGGWVDEKVNEAAAPPPPSAGPYSGWVGSWVVLDELRGRRRDETVSGWVVGWVGGWVGGVHSSKQGGGGGGGGGGGANTQ